MTLRLVSESPAPAPRAYEPPPQPRRLPTSAFAAHGKRLAPSRAHPDRVPAPPGGRAHITCCWVDLDLEQAVLVGLEFIARGRALKDEHGAPFPPYEIRRLAGRRAAELSGMAARLRPFLREDHPWAAQAAETVEKLGIEERHWLGVEGRRS